MRRINFIIIGIVYIFYFGCKGEGEAPGNGQEPTPASRIRVRDTIWVDRNAVKDTLHRIEVILDLPDVGYENLIVKWNYLDPDDPADDTNNVDPNGPEGNDNGYVGTGEDSLPAEPAKFFDAAGLEVDSSITNLEGDAEIYFQPSPDTKGWHHPGDNFIIEAAVGDSIYYSPIIYAWKRIKIEYDYMTSGKIPNSAFKIVQYIFSGRCRPGAGGIEDLNEKPYMWFDYNNDVYLKKDEEDLPNEVISTEYEFYNYIIEHRNMADTAEGSEYPVYLVGGYDTPIIGTYGFTLFINDTFPLGSIIFVEKIKDSFPFEWTERIGIAVAHELGHYIGRIMHDDPHTREDCIMKPGFRLECSGHRFCTFCIYTLRGNIYRYGRPIMRFPFKVGQIR